MNRWEPENGLRALRTGLIDAVQVVYNIFDQAHELALRFILALPNVTTIIPGMRRRAHVDANLGASDGKTLDSSLVERLRAHRWDRSAG